MGLPTEWRSALSFSRWASTDLSHLPPFSNQALKLLSCHLFHFIKWMPTVSARKRGHVGSTSLYWFAAMFNTIILCVAAQSDCCQAYSSSWSSCASVQIFFLIFGANDLLGPRTSASSVEQLRQAQSSNFGKLSRATSASSVEQLRRAQSSRSTWPCAYLAAKVRYNPS